MAGDFYCAHYVVFVAMKFYLPTCFRIKNFFSTQKMKSFLKLIGSNFFVILNFDSNEIIQMFELKSIRDNKKWFWSNKNKKWPNKFHFQKFEWFGSIGFNGFWGNFVELRSQLNKKRLILTFNDVGDDDDANVGGGVDVVVDDLACPMS